MPENDEREFGYGGVVLLNSLINTKRGLSEEEIRKYIGQDPKMLIGYFRGKGLLQYEGDGRFDIPFGAIPEIKREYPTLNPSLYALLEEPTETEHEFHNNALVNYARKEGFLENSGWGLHMFHVSNPSLDSFIFGSPAFYNQTTDSSSKIYDQDSIEHGLTKKGKRILEELRQLPWFSDLQQKISDNRKKIDEIAKTPEDHAVLMLPLYHFFRGEKGYKEVENLTIDSVPRFTYLSREAVGRKLDDGLLEATREILGY